MIAPDTKDWTWVLDRPCPECGFVAAEPDRATFGERVRATAATWPVLLARPGAAGRPDADTWSVLEYACHVRDVHAVFAERVAAMLAEDAPTFANWDQDETAVAERYAEQDPATVAEALVAAAERVARLYDGLDPADEATWARPGLRSNGSAFTVDSIARYHLHDVVHHGWDVRGAAGAATVAAYDADAAAYRRATAEPSEAVRAQLDRFAAGLPAGARVLEVGSGPGHDAEELERRGLAVRRTDVTPGFVALLREAGHEAVLLDPLIDDLADTTGEPYDAVWASACLLHVDRTDLPAVLARLAAVTRAGGLFHVSLKEGDGEGWSTHGDVGAPRRFVYWREEALTARLAEAGWRVEHVERRDGLRGERWLALHARRA